MLKTRYANKINETFSQDLRKVMNYLAVIFNIPLCYYSCNTLVAYKDNAHYTFGIFYDNNADAATNRRKMAKLTPSTVYINDPAIYDVLTHAYMNILEPITIFLSPYFNRKINITCGSKANIEELVQHHVRAASTQNENIISAYHELFKDALKEASNVHKYHRKITTTYNDNELNLTVYNAISNKFFQLTVGDYSDITILTNSTSIFNKGKILGVKIQHI